MSRRIPVVLSQAPAAHRSARQLEEDLVAELMFEPGVDASVVPHLQQLPAQSTGWLCLEGIRGDLIVLSWLEPLVVRDLLACHGIRGRTPISGEESEEDHRRDGRTIYLLQLAAERPAADFVRDVRCIRDQLHRDALSRPCNVLAASPQARPAPDVRPVAGSAPSPDPVSAVTPSASPGPADAAGPAPRAAPLPPRPGDDLDQLLDQLDAFDL
jgi:hypothetical protein